AANTGRGDLSQAGAGQRGDDRGDNKGPQRQARQCMCFHDFLPKATYAFREGPAEGPRYPRKRGLLYVVPIKRQGRRRLSTRDKDASFIRAPRAANRLVYLKGRLNPLRALRLKWL